MGTWGPTAWDSDAAADWFHEMFETTKLADFVGAALALDPNRHDNEIRAAASVLAAMGGSYVWPINRLKGDLRLAISQLEKVKDVLAREEPGYVNTIDEELAALQMRLDAFVDV